MTVYLVIQDKPEYRHTCVVCAESATAEAIAAQMRKHSKADERIEVEKYGICLSYDEWVHYDRMMPPAEQRWQDPAHD